MTPQLGFFQRERLPAELVIESLPMVPHGHWRADQRNLHLHRAAIGRLAEDPALRQRCLALVLRWRAQPEHAASAPYLDAWRDMLRTWPIERIAALVLDEGAGQAMRQCSPLAPALRPRERWSLLAEINRRLDAEAR
jgi:hypothetical protein